MILVNKFQKQPPGVFYKKRCSWKLRKVYKKTLFWKTSQSLQENACARVYCRGLQFF